MNRRQFLAATSAFAVAAALPGLAFAQEVGKLDFFVPANPGGGWDQTARLMDEVLRAEGMIGSSMITNVGGAGGTVGLPQFIRQYDGAPDTLMVAGLVMIGAIVIGKSSVDLSMVTPIARLTGEYVVIVVPAASEIQTLAELLDKLKADPRSVSWAGGSAGGTDHTLVGLISKEVGVNPVDLSWVAFAGGGEAMASLLGNQVTAGVSGWGEFAEQIAVGALRPLAISAPERVPGIDAPTIKEQGIDVELLNWRGVFAPPEVSDDDKARMIDLVTRMNASELWQKKIAERSWLPMFASGDAFETILKEDAARIEETLKSLGLVEG